MSYRNMAPKSRNFKIFLVWFLLFSLPVLNIVYAKFSPVKGEDVGVSEIQTERDYNFEIKSIDTQIISKHWKNVPMENIDRQVEILKSLGANYVAVSTPYDDPALLKEWAESIHRAGLSVWFRSHWLNWEGDEQHPSDMTIKEYLDQTIEFIKANPAFFKSGDAFTVCVEPEQVFTARGTDVYDWYSYNKFIVDQVDTADTAFTDIGLGGKIYTNWISMNGWVVENALESSTVDKLGLITVDHYPNQKVTQSPELSAQQLSEDLDRMYKKWQKPIILGEWGYNIERNVSDLEQREVLTQTFKKLEEKKYLIGLNYWAHMGNSSSLISDKQGSDFVLRPAAFILRDFYNRKVTKD